jgi:hypothetical protein
MDSICYSCSHSVGLGGSWTFMVTFFDESRVSTLFVFCMCLGFIERVNYLPKRHMSDSLYRFTSFRTQYSFSVTF